MNHCTKAAGIGIGKGLLAIWLAIAGLLTLGAVPLARGATTLADYTFDNDSLASTGSNAVAVAGNINIGAGLAPSSFFSAPGAFANSPALMLSSTGTPS